MRTPELARRVYEGLSPLSPDCPPDLAAVVVAFRLHEAMWTVLHQQMMDAFEPRVQAAIALGDEAAFRQCLSWLPHSVATAYFLHAWEEAHPDKPLTRIDPCTPPTPPAS